VAEDDVWRLCASLTTCGGNINMMMLYVSGNDLDLRLRNLQLAVFGP
jgi:hypothetical protein